MEVLVALVIVAAVAAIVAPTIMGRLGSARSDAIIAEMRGLQDGIMLFYRDVGRYPRRLDYLNTLANGDLDACGVAIPSANVAKFRGPYINRSIQMINPGGGITKFTMQTGDSVESVLTRTNITTTTGTQRVIQISVHGIDATTSDEIDRKADGRSDVSSGIIHVAGPIVKWTIPIRTNAC